MKSSVLFLVLAACGAAMAWPWPRKLDGLAGDEENRKVKALVLGVLYEEGGDGSAKQVEDEDAELQAIKSLFAGVQEELTSELKKADDGLQGPNVLQGPTGLQRLDGLQGPGDGLRGLDGLQSPNVGLRGLDGLLGPGDGLRLLDGFQDAQKKDLRPSNSLGLPDDFLGKLSGLVDDTAVKGDGDNAQRVQDDGDEEDGNKLNEVAVPRDDWWRCKVDNCRRNCNNQGKNGACVGPVCVCWS